MRLVQARKEEHRVLYTCVLMSYSSRYFLPLVVRETMVSLRLILMPFSPQADGFLLPLPSLTPSPATTNQTLVCMCISAEP